MNGTVAALALRIATGEVSAREAVLDQLARLHAVDDATHAVAWFDDELVAREAERLDSFFAWAPHEIGPLHGIPVTVKDWIDVAGFPCAGDTGRHDRRPAVDATAVRRLRDAGAVVIAKTLPWGPEPPHERAVRHPTHADRAPGGSSTGEAVAIAAGGSLVGLGSDSGGSIRLPASWCGVVGYKPTTGLVPTTGHFPRVSDRHDGRTQIGPLGRCVDDVALLLQVIAGADGLDSGAPPVSMPWHQPVDLAGVRFAVVTGDASSDTEAAVEHAASVLTGIGMSRTDWTAPWLADGMDITTRYWQRHGQTGAEVDRQLWDWDSFRYRYRREAAGIDVLVTPTTPGVAPTSGPIDLGQFRFTVPASLTGSPAIALPAGRDADGLPLSVQLVGRPWEDHRLLAIARAVESGG